MTGFICGPRIYEYKGVTIEIPGIGGLCACNKKGEPYLRYPKRVSAAIDEFWSLPEEDQAKYRTCGGCQRFGNE
jgi:hypothetical protein